MIVGHALVIAGVALYALAGSVLIRRIARGTNGDSKRRRLLLLPALGSALSLVCLVGGITAVYGEMSVPAGGLPLWLLAALCVAPPAFLASSLVVLAVLPPPPGGDDGGSGPDDLPPPPDPDGPDGWAEFERQFRAFARARDARRSVVLLR